MKILALEDPAVIEELRSYLPGSEVRVLGTQENLAAALTAEQFDCVVLDISNIDFSSTQPVGMVKRISGRCGLIITSENDLLAEKIDILRSGADDFLTKPYHVSELAARIVALERRVNVARQKFLVCNEISIDLEAKVVYVNDSEIDLTKKELELLQYFIEHKNNVIPKESLIAYLSGGVKDVAKTADNMYAHIKNLKKKLGAAGSQPYLKMIYGIGYKWEDS